MKASSVEGRGSTKPELWVKELVSSEDGLDTPSCSGFLPQVGTGTGTHGHLLD